ncbi:MAG: ATP-dependent DNA helicase [Lachnospiraceae bacterium]|nr:ATP-dependent DNA helicase [Lachnospiraceae bacterium]
MKTVRISVRNLVEFILRSGDIDERRGQGGSPETMLEGARIHRAIQAAAGSDYTAEVSMREDISLSDDIMLTVEGRADGVIDNKGYITIDEIKGLYLDVMRLAEPVEVHLAQAKCYAYIWAKQHSLSDISVRMTYVGVENRHIKLFNFDYEFGELSGWFSKLIGSYEPWARHIAEWTELRENSIKSLEFPYEYRPGQRELAADVYKTIYHKKKLFLEAPTGSGKTLATLYPSIKAVGEGLASYIFYLTAKNMGAKACADALELMRKQGGLRLKSVNILGKERACVNNVPKCNPDECDFAKGHFDRVNKVLYELLTGKDAFTREAIEEAAVSGKVCPYALARDLTEFSDCIVCDYNYVFDPSVALRHFFGEGKRAGDYIFLIDEAHNLVERARDMYSADLSLRHLGKIRTLIRGIDRKLSSYMTALIGQMELLHDELSSYLGFKDDTDLIPDNKYGRYGKPGYMILTDIHGTQDAASRLAGRFLELMQERRSFGGNEANRDNPDQMTIADMQSKSVEVRIAKDESNVKESADSVRDEDTLLNAADSPLDEMNKLSADSAKSQRKADRFSDEVIDFYFTLAGFVDVCDRLDKRYRIYTEMTESGDMRLRLLCVDPSHNLSEFLSYGRASVLFSATLLPVNYYMDLLAGNRDGYTVYASSIFDPGKLGVFVDTAVTSRYARRGVEEYRKIAEHIYGITRCRQGNYLVFFPSYAFLESVYKEYVDIDKRKAQEGFKGELIQTGSEEEAETKTDTDTDTEGAYRCICQTSEMSEQDRDAFLDSFDEDSSVIGFCVLGGLFAEGIDLTGSRLIGAIIIGTGLPQISNEKDILKEYFNDNERDGFDYAMKIPGMNKVLQAAGRVIRTENDTGVIALLDERFDKPDYKHMYPREWENIRKITGRKYNLIRDFWDRQGE